MKPLRICEECGDVLGRGRRKYCSDECADKGYRKRAWRHWWAARQLALERVGGKCERCGAEGQEVHHIVPLPPDEPRHNTQWNGQHNLEVLCQPCHEKAHIELRKLGKEANMERMIKIGAWQGKLL